MVELAGLGTPLRLLGSPADAPVSVTNRVHSLARSAIATGVVAPEEERARMVAELIESLDAYSTRRPEATIWTEAFVFVATMCNMRSVPIEFAESREDLVLPPRYARMRSRSSNGIDTMRNRAAQRMLSDTDLSGATHILFLDTDMIYPPDTLRRLVIADKDIISGIACDRLPATGPDGQPTFRHTLAYKSVSGRYIYTHTQKMPRPPGLHRCGRISMGGCLVKREVFERVARPWFYNGLFQKMPDGLNERIGEDIYFFTKAQEAGFEVWCDTTLSYGHLFAGAVWPRQREDGTADYDIRPTEVLEKA